MEFLRYRQLEPSDKIRPICKSDFLLKKFLLLGLAQICDYAIIQS